jgi:uncharacterized protein
MHTVIQHNKQRILTIDALRGFALFGIFLAHMIGWFVAGPLPEDYYQLHQDFMSGLTMVLYMLLINAKFFAIFSFLFGLSFYIQMESLSKRYANGALRFAWRLSLLGLIGIVHHCFWRSDILSIYVPLGFLLLFFRYLSDKHLLILGFLLILNIPSKIVEFIAIFAFNHAPLMDAQIKTDAQAVLYVMTQASFTEMLQHNLNAFYPKIAYQINSGRLWITLGFFLLGMLAGRWRWHENIDAHKETFKRICKKSAWIFLATLVVGVAVAVFVFASKMKIEDNHLLFSIAGLLFDISSASMALVYITGFTLLMMKPRWFNFLSNLAPAGKMALTTYLTQSLIGVMIFFPIGLGIFPLTTSAENAALAIAIFGLQIFFCRWWLQHFNYGPIEWLWRSGTEMKWQKLKK